MGGSLSHRRITGGEKNEEFGFFRGLSEYNAIFDIEDLKEPRHR